jgi:hypothetical protein
MYLALRAHCVRQQRSRRCFDENSFSKYLALRAHCVRQQRSGRCFDEKDRAKGSQSAIFAAGQSFVRQIASLVQSSRVPFATLDHASCGVERQ